MTYFRFLKIARATSAVFWPLVYQNVTPEEADYLRLTPVTRRNLDRRLFMALANTLLSPDQLSAANDLELEDPQTDILSGPTTATPLSKAIPKRTPQTVPEEF